MHLTCRNVNEAEGRLIHILLTLLHLIDIVLPEGCLYIHALTYCYGCGKNSSCPHAVDNETCVIPKHLTLREVLV